MNVIPLPEPDLELPPDCTAGVDSPPAASACAADAADADDAAAWADAASATAASAGTRQAPLLDAHRRAEQLLRLMAHAFASVRDALLVVDARWRVLAHNRAAHQLCGAVAPARGQPLSAWLGPMQGALDEVQRDGHWRGERLLQCACGAVPVEVSISAVQGDGDQARYLVALYDLRERRRNERRMLRLARSDRLTRLPNRSLALRRVHEALVAPDAACALLLIDPDGFQEINDSYGHDQGDRLLVELARRLRDTLDAHTLLARWDGDAFLALLPPGSGETELRTAAQQVLAALAHPFVLSGQTLMLTVSLGGVTVPQHGQDAATLLRKADLALQAGKARGGHTLVVYDDSLDDDTLRRVRMASLLRADTERHAFRFHVQPKVDRRGRPVGLELLMRWHTPALGEVSPTEFIPLAEKLGLIHLMGRHAVHAAAQLAADCERLGWRLPVAVNLSPRQLMQPGLEGLLVHACRRHGIAASQLELELTESALVHQLERVRPLLEQLRALGFTLALDDFGTGYSSLSYLRHLPFDKVKIDRSFIRDLDRPPPDGRRADSAARLLGSIVAMCRALELAVVVEGVETAAQAAMVSALGVDELQGFAFARPMPVEDWLALLRAHAVPASASAAARTQPQVSAAGSAADLVPAAVDLSLPLPLDDAPAAA